MFIRVRNSPGAKHALVAARLLKILLEDGEGAAGKVKVLQGGVPWDPLRKHLVKLARDLDRFPPKGSV